MAPENIEVVNEVDSLLPQDICSHVFSPSSWENMLVALAGSVPLMID